MKEAARLAIYGTEETPPPSRLEKIGPLSIELAGGAVCKVRWAGTEVVRGIASLVRDADWGTMAPEQFSERFDRMADRVLYECRCELGDGALESAFLVRGQAAGRLTVEAEISARRDFLTNRAGLTLLHPIAGVAGQPLTVTRPDGSRFETRFPERISPAQPATDIAGLTHEIGGVHVHIAFSGEVFEMEDQRNWSDASYKTYCRSLFSPYPYRIAAGETVRQRIEITLSGAPAGGVAATLDAELRLGGESGRVPTLRLAAAPDWLADESLLALDALGPLALTLRLDMRHPDRVEQGLGRASKLAGAEWDFEIVLPDEGDASAILSSLAERARAAGIVPRHVLALPAAYLESHQPSGPWPEGLSPEAAIAAARFAWPGAVIGGGMLTNFTELNRCPPKAGIDFVGHGSTATVHAADDASVVQTLEALPHIFASAEALAPGVRYRLGLVSIGARSNPYGADVVPNPAQKRVPLAEADPRQRGLFAAAWAVGVLSATAGSKIDSLALAAPLGPFGLVHRKESWRQPLFDEDPGAQIFPLYHIVRAVTSLAGASRLALAPLPAPLVAIASRTPTGVRVIVANPGEAEQVVRLPHSAQARVLDVTGFAAAVRDPFWLDTAPVEVSREIRLGAYATGFIELSKDAS